MKAINQNGNLASSTIFDHPPLSQMHGCVHGDDDMVKHICLPADLISNNTVKPTGLRKYYQGNLLDPVRFGFDFLGQQRKKLGEYAYACQYDQSPIRQEVLTLMATEVV